MNESCSLMDNISLDEEKKVDDYRMIIIEVVNNMSILDMRMGMNNRLVELAKTIRNI